MVENILTVIYNIRRMDMSINNKLKLSQICLLFVLFSVSMVTAVPVTLIEGGIPVVDPQKLVEEGIRYGNAELLRQAWKHYEDTISLSGATPMATLEMGKIYYNLSLLGQSTEEDFDTAEFFARQAVADNPVNPDAHHALGLILAGRGAYLDAFDELSLALNLNPGNELLIYDLAAMHITLRQPGKTIELLEGKNHKSGWPYVLLAMAWAQEMQKGKAVLNLLKAKKLGHSGYWVDQMIDQLSEELKLPLQNY